MALTAITGDQSSQSGKTASQRIMSLPWISSASSGRGAPMVDPSNIG